MLQLAEASEEGQGPRRAVEQMMIMIIITNKMADKRIFEVQLTLAPLLVRTYNDEWL
jgi:hypothetical protein